MSLKKMVPCIVKPSWNKIFNKIKLCNISHAVQVKWLNVSCQVEKLMNRGLIRVCGSDTKSFLQGVVTNDVRHLEGNCKSLYAMFLNTKGRVLYDSIIYKSKEEDTFYIECDLEALKDLEKHIKMYKLRKKVTIDSVSDDLKLWVLFNPKITEKKNSDNVNVKQEIVVPCSPPHFDHKEEKYFSDIIISQNSLVYVDPRLSSLGNRVIAPENEDIVGHLQKLGVQVETSSPWTYRMFRYSLGVGEGITELPTGKTFPLEANCDYLHGVSFHKGCYIGQELTARTHHTGVVRKRLMPILLHSEASTDVPIDTPIETSTEPKKSFGKLRGIEKNCALGLMRITEALEAGKFKIGPIDGETFRPSWWPQELPKERVERS